MKTKYANITDVFFDLDHTLWDFEKNSALAFETVLKMQDISINRTDFLSYYVPINFKYWEKYRKDEITQKELRWGRLKEKNKVKLLRILKEFRYIGKLNLWCKYLVYKIEIEYKNK